MLETVRGATDRSWSDPGAPARSARSCRFCSIYRPSRTDELEQISSWWVLARGLRGESRGDPQGQVVGLRFADGDPDPVERTVLSARTGGGVRADHHPGVGEHVRPVMGVT